MKPKPSSCSPHGHKSVFLPACKITKLHLVYNAFIQMTDLDAIFLAVLHGKLIKISLHNTELSEALFVFDSFFERTFALLGGSSKTWKAIEISAGPFSTNKPNLSFWRNPPRN